MTTVAEPTAFSTDAPAERIFNAALGAFDVARGRRLSFIEACREHHHRQHGAARSRL